MRVIEFIEEGIVIIRSIVPCAYNYSYEQKARKSNITTRLYRKFFLSTVTTHWNRDNARCQIVYRLQKG